MPAGYGTADARLAPSESRPAEAPTVTVELLREHLELLRRREPVKQLPPGVLLGSLCLQKQLAQPRHVEHLVRLVQHLLHLLHSALRRLGLLLNLLQRELHEARHLPHDLQLLPELPRILEHRPFTSGSSAIGLFCRASFSCSGLDVIDFITRSMPSIASWRSAWSTSMWCASPARP